MKGCLPNIMGANASAALMNDEKGLDLSPPDARYFGLHNFGNTCYCNSVLQALFFCMPFRTEVLRYREKRNGKHSVGKKDNLLACLCDLFYCITSQKRKGGVMQPKKFVARLRKENESFDNYMQHDAHEFFNLLLNSIHVVLLDEKKAERDRKRLMEQQTVAGIRIKKDRPSIFHRSRKAKSLKSNNSVNTLSKSGQDSSAAFIDCSSSQPQHSEELVSTDFPSSIGVEDVQMTQSADAPSLPRHSPLANSTPTLSSTNKAATFSLLSRIRHSKKISSSSKLLEENANSQSPVQHMEPTDQDTSTWIYDIFQGTYTTITRCLNCETVKNKDEDFLDLSVDIEQNTSITHCLRIFSHQQTLDGEHKYFCDACRSKQEAEIQMRLKKLPTILVLHLKRFKYCDALNKYTKLSYRVVYPFELRLFNTTKESNNDQRLYDLIGVVVHCGSGPYRGHYISVVKSHGMWMLFDDDNVERMQPSSMEDFFGVTADKNSESGYILFYECRK